MDRDPDGCEPGSCGCGSAQVHRREFLTISGVGLASLFSAGESVAGPFEAEDSTSRIPAEKKFKPEWLKSLTARGEPAVYQGDDLRFIGMPVGGICAGTVYLGGDGKLWLWNIFNKDVEGVVPRTVTYHGQKLGSRDGSAYVDPPLQQGPVKQGFALEIHSGGKTKTVTLDRTGFRDVAFLGQYPIGTVTYRDPSAPVSVTLEAYSPFIPLNADDSGLPAVVLSFTLKNDSGAPVQATLAGWLENAVALHHRTYPGARVNRIIDQKGFTFLESTAVPTRPTGAKPRPDVVFEDWTKGGYDGWTVQGTAFGKGPIARRDVPEYQGDLGGPGERVVNSHATAPGQGIAEKDGQVGKLVSRPFRVERRFVRLWIGGGSHTGETCVNLRVGGLVVASVTGRDANRMSQETIDARPFAGNDAVLEIVDASKGAWGNIGVGRITFSDQPAAEGDLATLFDHGTMGLALLGPPAERRAARFDPDKLAGEQADQAESPLESILVGALGRTLDLQPGASAKVHFVVAWHFPNLTLAGILKGRSYATRFESALAVADYVADNFDRLSAATHLWRETWYDSTLPYWFLDRTFANTSVLATTTCYRLGDGRFWAWEGVGCCPGTCTHVWHYAQAMGRIFPELERDLRERVDLGLSLDTKTGVIKFRGEFGDNFAVDGQCGVILRAYREHQMSADDNFLRRLWPRIKLAIQCVIDRDKERTGVLRGPMHNTLDADWFGVVPWLVGLYHAALRAGEEMAREAGDAEFAATCRALFAKGLRNLDAMTWNESHGYYVHVGDPAHPSEVGSYDGCHIDQVLGQSWAWQVGLGRVMDGKHVERALRSLYRHNLAPDVGPYRGANRAGRWYAMPGDGGLLMVTFPFGRRRAAAGAGAWSAMYFNECMSGFEWQAAAHMIWEGMATEGLAVARLIHDRYHPRLRNPYNEIECSDHYARSMASYGAFVAACGFEYHGPKAHIGFAPRPTPDDFRAPFTAALGWGTFTQHSQGGRLNASVRLKHGRLRLKTLALQLPEGVQAQTVAVRLAGSLLPATFTQTGRRIVIAFSRDSVVETDQTLEVAME